MKKAGRRSPRKPTTRDALFETRWIHVFEEDTPEGEVYRPETEDVPLSRRPRRRLSFSPDGTVRVLVPGPDDRPVEVEARWEAPTGESVPLPARRSADSGQPVIRIRDRSPTRIVVRK